MREYRKRKRWLHMNEAVERDPTPCNVEARDPGPSIMRKPGLEAEAPNAKLRRRVAVSKMKTALELVRPFPLGFLASQVCLYCYNTGYSSPGTRCSYCRSRAK
jgi:hypothetical protein